MVWSSLCTRQLKLREFAERSSLLVEIVDPIVRARMGPTNVSIEHLESIEWDAGEIFGLGRRCRHLLLRAGAGQRDAAT